MEDLWVKETMILIEDWQARKANLQSRIEEIKQEIQELDRKIEGGEVLLRAYRDKYDITSLPILDIKPGHFGNKSYPDMLVEIAQMTEGLLYVGDAVEIILRANVSRDKRAIQANIYSALRRMKRRFAKLTRGVYRYINHVQKPIKPSGVRQAVKELKEKNPQMTKGEVLNVLLRNGFDFRGKQPKRAVHMAWVSLGYAQKEKKPEMRLLTIDDLLKEAK